jgi:steroid delta-isomerase-like uncharacterized protein
MNVVRDHLDAFSTKNWDRYRETVLPNVVYFERATDRKVEGVDELIGFIRAWTTAFPDLRGTVQNMLFQDDMVMAEIRWEGTHDGLLKGDFGEIAPTGKKGVVEAIELFQFEGDRIREFRHYFDMMTLLKQLGAELPASPTLQPTRV